MKTNTSPLIIILTFVCLGLLPKAIAVSPPPDGGYSGGNTAEGQNALLSLTSGTYNTAVGIYSLLSLTDGDFCTGIGAGTLFSNTATENTATGAGALFSNGTGAGNTADGGFALFFSTTGNQNTAIGDRALFINTTGGSNTAVGSGAMLNNDTGNNNVSIGLQALGNNISGNFNVALGYLAGVGVTTANSVICIGAGGDNVDNRTYIGNINTTTVAGGGTDTVTVDLTTGLLGHLSSSRRYKEEIQPMDNTSEALYRLKPVTYRFKKEIDATQSLEYGLVAEDVAEVDPNLAIRDGKGQIESVRYTAINAMLLNEFLKEHKAFLEEQTKVQQQGTMIAELKKQIASLTTTVKEQATQIQKVSAHLELTKAVPQMAETGGR